MWSIIVLDIAHFIPFEYANASAETLGLFSTVSLPTGQPPAHKIYDNLRQLSFFLTSR